MRVHAGPHGSIGGEAAIHEELQRGDGEAFASAEDLPTGGDILPVGAGAGIEQHRDCGEIHHAARFLHLVAAPAAHELLQFPLGEVSEPRVARHLERGIALADYFLRGLHCRSNFRLVDGEEVELALLPKLVDATALVPDRLELNELRGHLLFVDAIGVIATGDLRFQLHLHRGLHIVLGQVHTLHHPDARTHNGVVLLIAHRAEPIDAPDAHPVENVGHHCLEPRVPNAGDHLRVVEVHLGAVATVLVDPRIVDAELNDLAKAAALLAEIDDNAHTSPLGALNRLVQGEDEIGPATTDVAAEDVRADALVVHPNHHLGLRIAQLARIAEGVDSATAYCRDVGTDIGVKEPVVIGELEKRIPQLLLREVQLRSQERQIPGIGDGALGGNDLFAVEHNRAIRHQGVLQLWDVEVGLARSDGRRVSVHPHRIEGGDVAPILLRVRVIGEPLKLRQVKLRLCAGLVPLLEVNAGLLLSDAPVGRMVPAVATGIVAALQVLVHGPPIVVAGPSDGTGRHPRSRRLFGRGIPAFTAWAASGRVARAASTNITAIWAHL
mmetsp:Transcript_36360/g.77415  ORF Transcript_36360/g.77415 Transcript_36360/m.77415 type:complete len:553 (+) Transcript_36360:776-2434(+)